MSIHLLKNIHIILAVYGWCISRADMKQVSLE